MTTRQKFEQMLFECGLFENQAKAIMDKAIPMLDALTPDYRITWDRPASEYPEHFFTVGFLTVKTAALAWIDENIPKAWFRAMFTETLEPVAQS